MSGYGCVHIPKERMTQTTVILQSNTFANHWLWAFDNEFFMDCTFLNAWGQLFVNNTYIFAHSHKNIDHKINPLYGLPRYTVCLTIPVHSLAIEQCMRPGYNISQFSCSHVPTVIVPSAATGFVYHLEGWMHVCLARSVAT